MPKTKKALSLLLVLAMLCSIAPAAFAAGDGPPAAGGAGTLEVTLRFDYPQRLAEVSERGVTLTLSGGGGVLGSYDLSAGEKTGFDGLEVRRAVRNRDGVEFTTEPELGYYDLTVEGLRPDTYTLTLTGAGYRTCTETVTLADFSKHVVLGTADATFTLGDVNGDGRVDATDRDAVSAALGQTGAEALSACDFNGDGAVDIIDLAYVNHNAGAVGGLIAYSTSAMNPAGLVELDAVQGGLSLTVDGASAAPGALFEGGSAVKVAPVQGGTLSIPLEMRGETELRQVQLRSPEGLGAVRAGFAEVLYVDPADQLEKSMTVPFDLSHPEGISLLSEHGGTVVIDLGRRVPVKKITITVERVEGQDGTPAYAVVEEIQFLRDIVPENPVDPNSQVRTLLAQPGNEQVTLKWSPLPNVSGYLVRYGDASGSYEQELQTQTPAAVVKGLKNLTTYYFTVTPVSEGWEGRPSAEVSATPLPAAKPAAPDFLNVAELDGALTISWGKSKNALSYSVYCRPAGQGEFARAASGLTELKFTVTGLENGVTYELYVTASNDMGEGAPSKTVTGTPYAVSYQEPEGIPTANRVDRSHISSISLTDSGNVAWSEYPDGGFQIGGVADGDYATHWTSQSYNNGNWARNKEISFTFDTPMTMSYVVWVPRQDGGYRENLRLYTITVTDSAGNKTVVADARPVPGSPGTTGYAVLPFAPTSDIKTISIKIEQRAYTAVSLAEVIFFTYDPENDLGLKVSGLFTDGSMTGLRPGVTAQEVALLQEEANRPDAAGYTFSIASLKDELALAAALLAGDRSALGPVLDGIASRSGGAAGNHGQGGSILQPLGAAAAANKEITVYASIPEGESVELIATQYNAEASTWQRTVARLTDGRNVVTIPQIGSQTTPRGGSLYLTYAGSRADEIKIQVRRAADLPMLELSNLDLAADRAVAEARIGAYLDELAGYLAAAKFTDGKTHFLNSTELSLPHALLSLPADTVQKTVTGGGGTREEQTARLYENALAWEQVMEIACKTQGIDDNSGMQTRQNVRYMQMFDGAFMYAAGSHIGVGYGSCGGLVSGRPVETMAAGAGKNQLFGWGIAHEIGHNMDKLGKAEITNNIYSLMVQTCDGAENTLPSRLETSGKYEQIFQKTALGYPGASNNVFVQLGMYWQLHLAYDGGTDPMGFYNRFFKSWKAGDYSGYGYEDRVALIAAQTAGFDLTEFFTRWGMRPGDGAKEIMSALPDEPRAIWFLDDQSRRDRLAGVSPAAGALEGLTAEAVVRDGVCQVQVAFACTADPAAVQGYEIYRNGRPVVFTGDTTYYIDEIGAPGNQLYTYQVRAYDTLGNLIDQAEAAPVRITYDAVADPASYTLERLEDGAYSAVFHEDVVTSLSGIKVTQGAAPLGAYTVQVRGPGDAEFQTAKRGDFSTEQAVSIVDDTYLSYVSYFTKPGASSQDTRIWTYDAAEVRVSGLPEDARVEFIRYAGDDISFLEETVMGLLAEPYTYKTMDGTETIDAGTLVIVGAYRGDPVFNYFDINGRYMTTELDEATGEQTVTAGERAVAGYGLMFAEVPEDGAVSDISDGFFLFVPAAQPGQTGDDDPLAFDRPREPEGASGCDGAFGLPAQIQARLYRSDDPASTAGARLTSDTLWIDVPSLDSLPQIHLNGMEVAR